MGVPNYGTNYCILFGITAECFLDSQYRIDELCQQPLLPYKKHYCRMVELDVECEVKDPRHVPFEISASFSGTNCRISNKSLAINAAVSLNGTTD